MSFSPSGFFTSWGSGKYLDTEAFSRVIIISVYSYINSHSPWTKVAFLLLIFMNSLCPRNQTSVKSGNHCQSCHVFPRGCRWVRSSAGTNRSRRLETSPHKLRSASSLESLTTQGPSPEGLIKVHDLSPTLAPLQFPSTPSSSPPQAFDHSVPSAWIALSPIFTWLPPPHPSELNPKQLVSCVVKTQNTALH